MIRFMKNSGLLSCHSLPSCSVMMTLDAPDAATDIVAY